MVMACIRQRGAKASKQRLGNAISRVSRLADIACKTRLVERGAGNQTFANQCNSHRRGASKSRTEKSDNSQGYTTNLFHCAYPFELNASWASGNLAAWG